MASEEEREENKGGKTPMILMFMNVDSYNLRTPMPETGQSFTVQKTFSELLHKTVL